MDRKVTAPARFAQQAEDLGYDSLWATEGLANQMAALDPVVTMAVFAEATSRITVGSSVILAPLRNPAILAKEIASLDVLSGGRIVLGVGVGGSSLSQPADFRVSGVDPAERGARCSEGIEVMRKLWTGERVSHAGRIYRFDDIQMAPVPVQKPHPPIWAGGSADGVLERTARLCDGFVPLSPSPAEYARMWDRVCAYAEGYGRDPSAITPAVHLYACFAETREAARAIAERTLMERYGFAVNLPEGDHCAFGNTDDCLRTIEAHREAGVEHVILNTVRPLAEVVADVELFATEVLPRLR